MSHCVELVQEGPNGFENSKCRATSTPKAVYHAMPLIFHPRELPPKGRNFWLIFLIKHFAYRPASAGHAGKVPLGRHRTWTFFEANPMQHSFVGTWANFFLRFSPFKVADARTNKQLKPYKLPHAGENPNKGFRNFQ